MTNSIHNKQMCKPRLQATPSFSTGVGGPGIRSHVTCIIHMKGGRVYRYPRTAQASNRPFDLVALCGSDVGHETMTSDTRPSHFSCATLKKAGSGLGTRLGMRIG